MRTHLDRPDLADIGAWRLPISAHTSQPWRINDIAPDFRVEDVWALPRFDDPEDFPRLVRLVASYDPAHDSPRVVRALFAIRMQIGKRLGWDRPADAVGSRVAALRDRLPRDLRIAAAGPSLQGSPFTTIYSTDDEWAAESANRTMHGVIHIGRVPDGAGFRAQLAILVKPNGWHGRAYMAAIKPFRHLLVYPVILRELDRAWRASAERPTSQGPPP
jgi:hypothetical protein